MSLFMKNSRFLLIFLFVLLLGSSPFLYRLIISWPSDTRPKEYIALGDFATDEASARSLTQTLLTFCPKPSVVAAYPWQNQGQNQAASRLTPLTIEHFRCRGSTLHPPRIIQENGKEINRFYDCSGSERHSLPLEEGKEHIYPILLELINEIQNRTNCPVIITSGHRCPVHQAYIDSSAQASGSKHLIGAQASFYVQGLEEHPEKVLELLFAYYTEKYPGQKEYATFTCQDTKSPLLPNSKAAAASSGPWMNKEIFIRLYQKHEGRDFDNRHPYPYLSIQVRFDRQKNERVAVSYQKANQLLRK